MTFRAQIVLALALALGLCVPGGAQAADYTLESAVKKLHNWGVGAVGYTEYRWQKESKEIVDSLVGSTIEMRGFPVKAGDIKVESGKATYARTFEGKAFGLAEGVELRSTDHYSTGRRFAGRTRIMVTIRDTSDRLALELTGETRINVAGRITKAGIVLGELLLDVEIATWTPST